MSVRSQAIARPESKFVCVDCRDTGLLLDVVREGVVPAIIDPSPTCAYENPHCFVICQACKGTTVGGRT